MHLLAVATFASGMVAGPGSLAGTFQADVSLAPAPSQRTLATIYQGTLHLHRDGTYDFSTLHGSGFWRKQGNRLVLISSGLFGTPYPIPDAVLRQRWPSGELEGIVLDIGPDGTLTLPRFGRVPGPVRFRPVPRRSTLHLLRASFQGDGPETMAAYMTLTDEMPAREADLLRILGDSRLPSADRRWCTFFFDKETSPAGKLKATAMLLRLSGRELPEGKRKQFFNSLSMNLLKVATPAMMPQMMEAHRMGRAQGVPLADAIGRLKYEPGRPLLHKLAVSTNEHLRSAAVRALGAFPDGGTLDSLLAAQGDPAPRVRIAYYQAVLGLSQDPTLRRNAVDALGKLLDKTEYQNKAILEALGGSGERTALPILVARLEQGDDYYRQIAAAQIARLGFPEGVPALLAIKTGTSKAKPEELPDLEQLIDEIVASAPLRKAAAEALYVFDQRAVSPSSAGPRTASGTSRPSGR